MAINDKLLGATGDTPSLDPRDHFGTVLYTGTGSSHAINGGKFDAAVDLNSNNGYINVGGASSVVGSATSDLSFSIWFKISDASTQSFIVCADISPYYGKFNVNNETNGKLRANFGNGTSAEASIYTTSTGWCDGNWHHLVYTMDWNSGSSYFDIKFYKDGSLDSSHTTSGTTVGVVGDGFTFGGTNRVDNGSFNPHSKATIDQARFYDSVLSASEVTELYNESYADSFKVNFPTGKTVTALYRFNGNANEETGAYDGTASNVIWKYGVNFTPDWVWIAQRNASEARFLQDSVRGSTKTIYSSGNYAETTEAQGVTSFDSGGFTLGTYSGMNGSSDTYVAWCWNAGGSNATNNVGSTQSTVRANTDAGFSIVKFTGGGSATTVGHGLGAVPNMIILKNLDTTDKWRVYNSDLGATKYLNLNDTDPEGTASTVWNDTTPTSTVFSVGSDASVSGNTNDIIAYCIANVDSYQKADSYTGNGSASGPMVETGFAPAFVMIKRSDASGEPWAIYDSTRNTSNPRNCQLRANTTGSENCGSDTINFYSDGFQPTSTWSGYNASGGTYIYLAIAAPAETTTPVVADSFNVTAYAGTSADQDITMNFGSAKPDLVWIKNRDATYSHALYDSIRGAEKVLSSDSTAAEDSDVGDTYGLKSFNTNGFGLGNNGAMTNTNGNDFISFGWKASNSTEIITGGTEYTVASINDDAGFSIVEFTNTTASTSTRVPHGLSAAPNMIIVKRTDGTENWYVYHSSMGTTKYMRLDLNDAEATATNLFNTVNATVFNPSYTSTTGQKCIAYCWRKISGFSAFGTYTGNGGSNPITVDDGGSGFQPDFVMAKPTSTGSWLMMDSARGANDQVYADLTDVEYTDSGNSFHSTGFTMKSNGNWNNNGTEYIYAAFKIN